MGLASAEVTTGNGSSSAPARTVHVGLGSETTVDVRVALPFGGAVVTHPSIVADQAVTIVVR